MCVFRCLQAFAENVAISRYKRELAERSEGFRRYGVGVWGEGHNGRYGVRVTGGMG